MPDRIVFHLVFAANLIAGFRSISMKSIVRFTRRLLADPSIRQISCLQGPFPQRPATGSPNAHNDVLHESGELPSVRETSGGSAAGVTFHGSDRSRLGIGPVQRLQQSAGIARRLPLQSSPVDPRNHCFQCRDAPRRSLHGALKLFLGGQNVIRPRKVGPTRKDFRGERLAIPHPAPAYFPRQTKRRLRQSLPDPSLEIRITSWSSWRIASPPSPPMRCPAGRHGGTLRKRA